MHVIRRSISDSNWKTIRSMILEFYSNVFSEFINHHFLSMKNYPLSMFSTEHLFNLQLQLKVNVQQNDK